jgi:FkbM family methyltransferase
MTAGLTDHALEQLTETASGFSDRLPHIKIPAPYSFRPLRLLKIYPDTELSRLRIEPAVQAHFKRTITQYESFFDIGAHMGTYSMIATLNPTIEVHAFEPHPGNVKRLTENIKLNDLTDQINVTGAAVTDTHGDVELFSGNGNAEHNIISQTQDAITVDGITLDNYSDKHDTVPELIKVDIEGAGGLVLDGAADVLETTPDWLVEIHTTEEAESFERSFNEYGYTVTEVDDRHWFATA